MLNKVYNYKINVLIALEVYFLILTVPPGGPVLPRSPTGPESPDGPRGPWAPGFPSLPGGPYNNGRQNKQMYKVKLKTTN